MVSRKRVSLEDEDHTPARQRISSRKRSKLRPKFENAFIGMVLAVERGHFTVEKVDENEDDDKDQQGAEHAAHRTIDAIKAREIGRKGVIVGDLVKVVATGERMGRIVSVEPRSTMLRRSADDSLTGEKPIVANATQLGVVIATSNPTPNFGLADRAIIAAIDAGITPFVIATKCDLAPASDLIEVFTPLGVEVLPSIKGHPASEISQKLSGERTVLVGESGVGKSTLVNALAANANRRTGEVSTSTSFGRHTSSSLVALPLPDGGYLIDTPGLRTFGLAHVTTADFANKLSFRVGEDNPRFRQLLELVGNLPAQRD